MSKAVLVMDMPKSCYQCPCFSITKCRAYKTGTEVENDRIKPDWCPLKPMPEKIGIEEALKMPRNGCIGDVINTYNACIDEILGDKE